MNWRRGLFRGWVVLSIAWVVVYVVVFIRELNSLPGGYLWADVDIVFVLLLMGVFAGPPFGVFLVGLLLVWVFLGFRRG